MDALLAFKGCTKLPGMVQLHPGRSAGDTETVPDFCTCGAQLPPDARFCHKCGKPQYETPVEIEEAPPETEPETAKPSAPATPPVPLNEISYRNSVAVRIAFLAAGIASLLISFPLPVYFAVAWLLLWLFSSGFLAVFLYVRRTGQKLTVRSGARMGWITGMFCFAIATVFFTISVIAVSSRGGLASFYREQFGARADDANIRQFLDVLQNPAGLATMLLLSLLFLFVLFTLLPTMGGALGAKVLAKD